VCAGYLVFGDGGVDDAEDADVILHEYGHAIQDFQAPGKYSDNNCNTEATAMGEGFGDYWAVASSTYDKKVFGDHYGDPACVAAWDAAPGCLRRLDTQKKYPTNVVGECHADGGIWSGALWDLFNLIGTSAPSSGQPWRTNEIVLQSHFNVPASPTFLDGVKALLKADNQLYPYYARHRTQICKAMIARGLATLPTSDACTWEPWGETVQDNHFWNTSFRTDQGIESLTLVPVDGVVSVDNLIAKQNNAVLLESDGLHFSASPLLFGEGDMPIGVTKAIIRFKAHGFYNTYPPNVGCKEWGIIRLGESNLDGTSWSNTTLITSSDCPGPFDRFTPEFNNHIINNNEWVTREFALGGPVTQNTYFAFDVYDQTIDSDGTPYPNAHYTIDVDFIDFK
jgi:hypothetical protein